ncbi:structure-specific endonuclease subunit SLX1 homolog [Anopheles cruzii]|uniref:structure-specific endonuclease subunit SLX1 homolog n=1 Tax=Anopheles cruzii TaxID=68878 RepID=UPI0022EC8995|nr:structure-specific endonuclease subunit SLX1 homolog [Anopheles cruzii]
MVMIIHGFPNNISALRFEWAWQQPRVSRRLKQIPELQKKLRKESNFEYNFRILSEMLRIGPWNRLPLTIRWFADDFHRDFEAGKSPPLHMPICFGRVKKMSGKKEKKKEVKDAEKKSDRPKSGKIDVNYDFDEYDLLVMGGAKMGDDVKLSAQRLLDGGVVDNIAISSESEDDGDAPTVGSVPEDRRTDCVLCRQPLAGEGEQKDAELALRCIQPRCHLISHLACLAERVLEPGQYVPVEGDCPICETHFLWGDVIRKSNGCSDLVEDVDSVAPLEVYDVSDEDVP